jgi:ABC-2 type transport system ATP-binding protein
MHERAAQELSPKVGRMGAEDPSTAFADAPPGAAAGSPAIQTVNLSKRFGHTTALAGLSMTVPRGEVFGFLGPNGAGKTTSVKLLLGLLKPTSGQAWLLGRPIGDLHTRRRIGYLPELFRYQGWLSAREVLALHCELAPLPRSSWKDEITSALDTVGLTDRAGDRVSTFSKGMQQRLGLAAALLGEPELVFLDEPTSALDPVGRHDVREIIRGLASRGTAVFLNSHLLSEVEQVCDRVAVVDHGRVIAAGTMNELLSGTAVKVRVAGLDGAAMSKLADFGKVDDEGDQLTFTNLNPDRVPDLVAAIVALGGKVFEVSPRHQTLEDRFLQLLEEEVK